MRFHGCKAVGCPLAMDLAPGASGVVGGQGCGLGPLGTGAVSSERGDVGVGCRACQRARRHPTQGGMAPRATAFLAVEQRLLVQLIDWRDARDDCAELPGLGDRRGELSGCGLTV